VQRQKEMSFIAYFLVIGLMLALSPATVNTAFATPPSHTTWSLVWSDEFSGTSIDGDKWAWGVLPWGGYWQTGDYVSYTTADDSYLSNGSMILRSRKGDYGGQPWSQGFMFGNEWVQYGYGEIRAKHTRANGIWVGFWMLHYGWPPEFDPAEFYGTDDIINLALFYSFGGANLVNRISLEGGGWDNWHTFGIEWGPGYAYFYVDDVLKHSIEESYVPALPMYLILQSGMHGTYDAQTPNPNYYEVDYIRWYKDDNLPRYQDPAILPTIIDSTNDAVTYTGTWYEWEGNPAWMGFEYYTAETDAIAEFSFTGSKVAWYSCKRNDLGIADIYIDDEKVGSVDCYKPGGAAYHQKMWESSDLTYGSHTIGIKCTGTKRRQSSGVEIIIDCFRYNPYTNVYCGNSTCDGSEDKCNCPGDCGAPPSTETSCTDEIDNDCDGYTDCDDSDCDSDPACQGGYCGDDTCDPGEDQCNCPEDCGTPPSTETSCTDEIDNDCDTYVDCDDSDCDEDPACQGCDNDGTCESGEDCNNCPNDCEGKQTGPPSGRYCCGNGIAEDAEGDGSICDGNY